MGKLGALTGDGAEPAQVITDLADAVHAVTLAKAADASDPAASEAERASAADLAARLSMPVLARAWQMLLKGHEEVRSCPGPLPPPTWFWCASLMPPICRLRPIWRAFATALVRLARIAGGAHPARKRLPSPPTLAEAPPLDRNIAARRLPETRSRAVVGRSHELRGSDALAGEKRDLKLKHASPSRCASCASAPAISSSIRSTRRRKSLARS